MAPNPERAGFLWRTGRSIGAAEGSAVRAGIRRVPAARRPRRRPLRRKPGAPRHCAPQHLQTGYMSALSSTCSCRAPGGRVADRGGGPQRQVGEEEEEEDGRGGQEQVRAAAAAAVSGITVPGGRAYRVTVMPGETVLPTRRCCGLWQIGGWEGAVGIGWWGP
jgi:hypothetical protein